MLDDLLDRVLAICAPLLILGTLAFLFLIVPLLLIGHSNQYKKDMEQCVKDRPQYECRAILNGRVHAEIR